MIALLEQWWRLAAQAVSIVLETRLQLCTNTVPCGGSSRWKASPQLSARAACSRLAFGPLSGGIGPAIQLCRSSSA